MRKNEIEAMAMACDVDALISDICDDMSNDDRKTFLEQCIYTAAVHFVMHSDSVESTLEMADIVQQAASDITLNDVVIDESRHLQLVKH
jgi:hypothetical protein